MAVRSAEEKRELSQYMERHDVAQLVDKALGSLMSKMPDNPALYLSEALRAAAGGGSPLTPLGEGSQPEARKGGMKPKTRLAFQTPEPEPKEEGEKPAANGKPSLSGGGLYTGDGMKFSRGVSVLNEQQIRPDALGMSRSQWFRDDLQQERLQGMIDALTAQEVRESMQMKARIEDIMEKQSRTGVIYATSRASQFGFKGAGDPNWGNLGQGAPETEDIPGQPSRAMIKTVETDPDVNEYSSVNGCQALREAIADYYNHWWRKDKTSQYTAANVCVVSGGRMGLNRLMATLNNVNIGYFLPEYTAYSQLLGAFQGVSPIPVAHDLGDHSTPGHLREQVRQMGLGSFLISNPGNPTGRPIEGEDLDQYVQIARDEGCLFMMDEFYNHYMYEDKLPGDDRPFHSLSSAEFVDDVDTDPICIINGFTKNWRLPGWRVCWIVGPKHCMGALASVGSFMDGGAPHPLQKAAVPLLSPSFVRDDALALQAHFRGKRDFMVNELTALGIIARSPEATFYIWADVRNLPTPLNNGVIFFEYCVRHKVIAVPGIFFDLNPFGRRRFDRSKFMSYLRMSFGPAWPNLRMAIDGMKTLVTKARQKTLGPLTDELQVPD